MKRMPNKTNKYIIILSEIIVLKFKNSFIIIEIYSIIKIHYINIKHKFFRNI